MNWVPARRPSAASKYSSNLAQSRPPSVSPNSLNHGLQVHLQTRSITTSKCISKLTQSRPPSASLTPLDLSLRVHLQTRSIAASKCISEFTQSPSPSASQTRSIKYIFKERRRLYRDTGVTEVDRVTGSIYSADRSQSRYSVCRWVAI